MTSYLNSLKEADTYDDILKLQEEQRILVKHELEQLQKEIKAIKKDIETLEQNIPSALRGEGNFSPVQLSALMDKNKQQLIELEHRLEIKNKEYKEMECKKKDIKNIGSMISNWGELFMECSIPERKVMLSKLIERIDVKENDIKIKFKISLEEYMGEKDGRKGIGSPTTLYTPCSA